MTERFTGDNAHCLNCGEPSGESLYCTKSCFDEDENKILESPITGELYYVTEWEDRGDGRFVALKKERIDRALQPGSDRS